MSVIVVGLNHRTAPVELRERVAVPASRILRLERQKIALEDWFVQRIKEQLEHH